MTVLELFRQRLLETCTAATVASRKDGKKKDANYEKVKKVLQDANSYVSREYMRFIKNLLEAQFNIELPSFEKEANELDVEPFCVVVPTKRNISSHDHKLNVPRIAIEPKRNKLFNTKTGDSIYNDEIRVATDAEVVHCIASLTTDELAILVNKDLCKPIMAAVLSCEVSADVTKQTKKKATKVGK